jgi:hypothetical protein
MGFRRISVLGGLLSAIILLVVPSSQAYASGGCDGTGLPLGVQQVIQQRFPGWGIVTIKDLDPDSQKIWLEAHPKECPGFAVGNLDGSGATSCAVSLWQHRDAARFGMLLILTKEKAAYKLHIVAKAEKVGTLSVVSTLPPGNYSSADGTSHVRANFPVILYEALEVGALIYYWDNGRYNSLLTSE